MSAYDTFPKKNFIYKTRLAKRNPVTRHDSAILIPKDRPQPVAVDGIGQSIAENYWSKSEDRWIIRLSGPLPARPAVAVVTYKGGGKESFKIESLAGRTEYAPGPWNGATSSPVPSTPTPSPAPSKPVGGSITFPPSYAGRVGLVALVGGKGELCARDPQKPGRWTHKRSLEPRDFYAIKWDQKPPAYVKAFDLGAFGLWSYFDDGDFQSWPNKQVPVAPTPATATPLPTPPAQPAPLYTRTDTTLTLRPDFAAVVRKVDALANVTHGRDSESIKVAAVRTGNTWTLPQPLGSYKRGAMPNTWRISLVPGVKIPDGVTYHTSIMQSFIQETTPAGKTYPPTIRS